jgi:hypothetical protein
MGEPVDFVLYDKTIENADEVRQLMEAHECQDLVTVLPLNILAELSSMGIKPIRARMGRVMKPDGFVEFNQHLYFERINSIKVETELLNSRHGLKLGD